MNDGVVFFFEIAQFKRLDILFNDSVEVNHVVGVQLVVLDVKRVEGDVYPELLVLLDVVDDILSVVSNALWVAVRGLRQTKIMILTEPIIPMVN